MKLWMRRLALALGVVVLGVAGVAAYLLATFDPNRYQGLLTDWVQTNKQRTLVIGAPMELKIFPQLRLKLAKVSLSEHQRAEEFLAVDEVELSVNVMPLLKRQLVIDQVSARGVRMSYWRDAQGRSNIDDLLKRDEQLQQPGAPSDPLQFDVAGIQLAQVQAKVQDAKTGLTGALTVNSLSSGRLADGVPSDVKLDLAFDLSQPQAAKGALKGAFRITPRLATGSADVDQIKLALQGDVPGVRALQAGLEGAVAWDGEHASLKASTLVAEVSGQVGGQPGKPALVLDKSRVSVDVFAYDPAQQLMAVSKLAVALTGQQEGHAVSFKLDWPELDVKGDQLKGSPLQGQFKLAGPMAVDAQFASQSPTGGFSAIKVPGLKVDFKVSMAGQGGQREVAGQLSANVSAQPAQAAGALEALHLQARIQEPSLQPLVIQMDGRAAMAPGGAAQWALKGQVNDNPFSSDGTAKLGQGVPKVQAQARFTALDLNRLLPAPAGGVASAPAKSAGAAADAPVDLRALKAIDGQFKFSAGTLVYRQYKLADAELNATLDQGHLNLSNLSAKAWGGRVVASGSADAAPQRMALQAQADGIDILAMLKDVAQKDVLEGTGQVKLDVHTGGAKVSQLVAGLNGTAALQLRDGAVRGINLAKSLREFKAQLSGQTDAVQRASQSEKTDFTELTGTFKITNGVARNDDLAAKSPFLRLGGRGDINLVARQLDYTVSATVTGTSKGQGGADALNGLTVPVKLKGPFDAPDWQIAWSQVAVGALQNTVKSRLEDELKARLGLGGAAAPVASGASAPAKPAGSLEKQLKDQLKGLFR
ncbi:MAG: AsmA family protein [Aquabacterium sp.]|uniref:AsmA family protein n=1 Tax=Aquabacterium sp. TaxID=1872578 RepID=UPI002717BD74|nr:AsmA family protein [Aquabacterium sp.]MDO9004382.1 AsmA family protein [Aquabacterium sp.]